MEEEIRRMIKSARKELKIHKDYSLADKSYIEGKIRWLEICLILLKNNPPSYEKGT